MSSRSSSTRPESVGSLSQRGGALRSPGVACGEVDATPDLADMTPSVSQTWTWVSMTL